MDVVYLCAAGPARPSADLEDLGRRLDLQELDELICLRIEEAGLYDLPVWRREGGNFHPLQAIPDVAPGVVAGTPDRPLEQ